MEARPSRLGNVTELALVGLAVVLSSCAKPDTDGALRRWMIGPAPTLTIGGDGSPETELSQVNGAWRLSNGAIAIADGGANAIRIFDARGGSSRTFGRSGAGPGEFRQMAWTGRFGDTAVVYDGALRRITTILLVGTPRLLATLRIAVTDDRAPDGVAVRGRLADGRWLVRAMGRPDVNASGLQRIPGLAGLIGSGGAGAVEWLAEAPDMAVLIYNPTRSRKMVSVLVAAFAPSFAVAAGGSSIWLGDTAADTIVRVDAATGTRRKITLPDPLVPVTGELVDAARARDLAEARDQAERDLVEVKYAPANLPTKLPAFRELVIGAGGELWVQSSGPSQPPETRYLVFSASGGPIARVSIPGKLRITDVGPDWVVGVHRDDDDVESVRLYRLVR